eukprot:NODE_403_length_8041_cov_0.563712.p3 type:complete len:380 gc:universal NODE_403_length_8041_cov_0.563712:6879-8018(+)
MRIFGSQIMPCISQGLQIWEPTRTLCKPIEKFIKDSIRDLSGTASFCSISDLHSLFDFTDFYSKWSFDHLKWNNHRVFIENEGCCIAAEPVRMSFRMSKKGKEIQVAFPGIKRLIQRNLPVEEVDCPVCHGSHNQPNGIVLCLKNYTKSKLTRENDEANIRATKLDVDLFMMENKSKLINESRNDQSIIYTDGSLTAMESNSAYCIIQNNALKYKSANITDYYVNSSTRAEIMAILIAIKDPELDRRNEIIIRSDSKSAIASLQNYQNGMNYRYIHSADLIQQVNLNGLNLKFEYVKAHADVIGNNFCDLLCRIENQPLYEWMDIKYNVHQLTDVTILANQVDHDNFVNVMYRALQSPDDDQKEIKSLIREILMNYFNK